MNVTVNSQVLAQELRLLEKVVSAKAPQPVLQNALFVASGADSSLLQLHATDLNVGLSIGCAARVHEPGATTLPVKKLSELVNQFTDGDVSIRVDKGAVRISHGKFQSRLQTLDAGHFPEIPQPDSSAQHSVSLASLQALIARTRFATADKNVRFFMSGAQLTLTETVAAMVAIDGRRLALATTSRQGDAQAMQLLSNQALDALRSLDCDETPADYMSVGERHAFFQFGSRRFYARLVDGTFADYQRIIPRENAHVATLNRVEFLSALKRVSSVTDQNSIVFFAFDANGIALTASSAEVGDAAEHVAAIYTGPVLKLGLSARFVLDFLEVARNASIDIRLKDGQTPVMLADGTEYLNVVMPMR